MTTPVQHMSPEQFRAAGLELVDWIAHYLQTVESRPVMAQVAPGDVFNSLPASPPQHGEPWAAIWQDFQDHILPGVTHWQSPHFHAYFPCNNSGPAILGELLSAGLGINGFLWQCSPSITELEMRVTDWLGAMIGLPPDFLFGEAGAASASPGGGVILGTASEAVLTAMVAARSRWLHAFSPAAQRAAPDGALRDTSFVAYASPQAHSSVVKAAMVAGIGRGYVRLIPGDATLAMNPEALGIQIRDDLARGLRPFFICATVGSTSTGAIDPINRLAQRAADHAPPGSIWLHVDAAYAGAAMVCPEFRPMIEGVERADSFNFNPHKWLLTNFDCSLFWTRDRAALNAALSITPEYLRNKASASGQVIDYRDWQVPLGRRFRALKLWFVLRHYGVEGLRAYIREHVRLATLFESLVRTDDRFEIPCPRCLSLVCIRLKGPHERTTALLERVNATGRTLLTQTVVPLGPQGQECPVIRVAIGATQTQETHVRALWDLLRATASTLPA